MKNVDMIVVETIVEDVDLMKIKNSKNESDSCNSN